MEVRIGVEETPKEVVLEMAEGTKGEDIQKTVNEHITSGEGVLWLTDKRGRQVGVPAEKIAYVEIGGDADRRVGFGAP